MKYRSQWNTFIFRSNIGSYWLIILKYDGYTSNSLQNIRQNHWTMKYRSQWPTFILRSNVRSYWLIIPKYDVLTWNGQGKTYIYFVVKCLVILTYNPKVWCSYIKQSSRYKARSLDRETYVTSWPTSQCHKVEPCLTNYLHKLFP